MATTPPSITAAGSIPDPTDRATYNTRAYAFMQWMKDAVAQFATVATNVYDNAVEAFNSATSATASATAAAAAAGAAMWVSGTTYTAGVCVSSPANQQTYRRVSTGAGTTDPSADAVNWTQISSDVTRTGVQTITKKNLADFGLSYYNSSTTNALTLVNGPHQRWAPNTGAQTLTLTAWAPSGQHSELLIEGVNLGAATITWPTINWVKKDGTFTTTVATYLSDVSRTLQASGTDFVFLWTRDGGTTIYGKLL